MNSILPLIGLALLDSLSVGAIVVPIGLLLTWGSMRKGAYATYPVSYTHLTLPTKRIV